MKETEKNDCPDRSRSGDQQHDCETCQSREAKQRKQPGGRNMFHNRRSSKSSNHESEQMNLQVVRSYFFWRARQGVLGEADYEACHPHLSPHVKKLCNHTLN